MKVVVVLEVMVLVVVVVMGVDFFVGVGGGQENTQ